MLTRMVLLGAVLAAFGLGQSSVGYPRGKWREPKPMPRTLNPSTGVHDTGFLTVTIDDVGGQEGWRYTCLWPDTTSIGHLYWNWLAVGLDSNQVVDGSDFEWQATPGGSLAILEPGPLADEQGQAEFADFGCLVRVRQHSYAWNAEPDQDYIIVAYTVVNTSGSRQDSVLIAHRTDFDVMGDHGGAMTDMSGFDSARTLAYMWDVSSMVHAGVSILSGRFHAYHTGWHNMNDADKYYIMNLPGADPATPFPDDYCIWLSAGPYQLPAGDSFEVAFAYLAGDSLADLQSSADEALAKWQQLSVAETRLARPDAREATTICRGVLFLPPASGVQRGASSVLLDISGRKVMDLKSGANDVPALSPGVYFMRAVGGERSAVSCRKVIVTR